MNIFSSLGQYIFAGILAVLAVLQFLEIGKPFNNRYIYAKQDEKDRMDLHQYFRQSAYVLICLAVVFLFNGLFQSFGHTWMRYVSIGFLVITVAVGVGTGLKLKNPEEEE